MEIPLENFLCQYSFQESSYDSCRNTATVPLDNSAQDIVSFSGRGKNSVCYAAFVQRNFLQDAFRTTTSLS